MTLTFDIEIHQKVIEVFPSTDKRIRVVNLKTSTGTFNTPIHKLHWCAKLKQQCKNVADSHEISEKEVWRSVQ